MSKKLSCNERRNICRNTKDPEVLAEYALDSSMRVRQAVASNPCTSEDTLDILSRDCQDDVRFYVAENPSTSEKTLVEMAENANEGLAWYLLVRRWEVPNSVIRILADSSYCKIRVYVASNHQATIDILDELSGDIDVGVRRAVAGNPNTPAELLDQMQKDTILVQQMVAGNPNTERRTLEKMRGITDEEVQVGLSMNEHTPEDMLRRLASTDNDRILRNLAENCSTPTDILDDLMKNPDLYRNLARNPHLSESSIRALFATDPHQTNYRMLQIIASNPSTPNDILEKLAEHEFASIRECVATNPSISTELRLKLANDRWVCGEILREYEITELKKKAV